MLQLEQQLAQKLQKTLAVKHSKVKKLAWMVRKNANGPQVSAHKEIAQTSLLLRARLPDSIRSEELPSSARRMPLELAVLSVPQLPI